MLCRHLRLAHSTCREPASPSSCSLRSTPCIIPLAPLPPARPLPSAVCSLQGTLVLRHVFDKSGRNAAQLNPKRRRREDSEAPVSGACPPSPLSSPLPGGSVDCQRIEAMALDDSGSDAEAQARAQARVQVQAWAQEQAAARAAARAVAASASGQLQLQEGQHQQQQQPQGGMHVQPNVLASRKLDFEQLKAVASLPEARNGGVAGVGQLGMSPLEHRLQQVVEAKAAAVGMPQAGRTSPSPNLYASSSSLGMAETSGRMTATASWSIDDSLEDPAVPHSSTSVGESATNGAVAPSQGSTTPQFPCMPHTAGPSHLPGVAVGDPALDLSLVDFGTELDDVLLPLPGAVSIKDGISAAATDTTGQQQQQQQQQQQAQAQAAVTGVMMEGRGDFVPAGEGEGDYANHLLSDMLLEQGGVDDVPLVFDAHLPGGVPPAAHPSGVLLGTGAEGLDELMAAPAGDFTSIMQEALSFDAGEVDNPVTGAGGGGGLLSTNGSSSMQGPVGVAGSYTGTVAAPSLALGAPAGAVQQTLSQESSAKIRKLTVQKKTGAEEESCVPQLLRSNSMPEYSMEADDDLPELTMAQDMVVDMGGVEVAPQGGGPITDSAQPGVSGATRPRARSKYKFPTVPADAGSANIKAPSTKKFGLKSIWQKFKGAAALLPRSSWWFPGVPPLKKS